MILKTRLAGKVYEFQSVKDVMAKANELKSGDVLAGLAAESDSQRVAAKEVLSNLLLSDLRNNPAVDYEIDDVTRMDQDGVDAAVSDQVGPLHPEEAAERLKAMARSMGAILAATGGVDLVTDGVRCFVIHNGRPEMSRIPAPGRPPSAPTTSLMELTPEGPLEAAAAAVCAMGLAGELGWARMGPLDGNIAYRGYLIDAIYHLSGEMLEKGARYEVQ